MISVRMTDEVLTDLQHLLPEPRHALKLTIQELTEGQGDIRPLSDELEGFHRLRVCSQRVIFEYEKIDNTRTITVSSLVAENGFTKSSKAAFGRNRNLLGAIPLHVHFPKS